ncbi:MAG: asparagine synthase-related protein [Candidatus Woesearchaeota archaeon]
MFQELFIKEENNENKLIPFNEWENLIDNFKKLSKNIEINDENLAVEILKKPIENAIKKRIPDKKENKRFGIFFSGGVDSTLIAYLCKKFNADFICYTVGFKGSKDLQESKKISKYYGFDHKTKELSLEESEKLFKKTAKILGNELNIVNLGVGSVELAAIELAEKDNIDLFFGGLGSEEIFAGYQRHEKAEDINKECWDGLKTMYERDFKRDFLISKAKNVSFLTPFLDDSLIIEAMKISGNLKIKDNHKKYILRKTALSLGLKEDFCFRQKIAAQYGSNFDKAIEKITKKYGFKMKREYLEYLKKEILFN